MARNLIREWKNKRSGFTRRARWYAESLENMGVDIRISLEDHEIGIQNHYPKTQEDGESLWQHFKIGLIDIYGKEAVIGDITKS